MLFKYLTDLSKTSSLHFPTVHFLDVSEYDNNFMLFSSQKNQKHNSVFLLKWLTKIFYIIESLGKFLSASIHYW